MMTTVESYLTAYALGSGLGRPRYLSENAEATGRPDMRTTAPNSHHSHLVRARRSLKGLSLFSGQFSLLLIQVIFVHLQLLYFPFFFD